MTLACSFMADVAFAMNGTREQGMGPCSYRTIIYTGSMSSTEKDRRTLQAIGRIYCQGNHAERGKDVAGMCSECGAAIEQTLARAEACPHGHEGNCQDCATPCQRGEAQERIKAIMRYAAPRMLVRHPLMTLEYLRKKVR